MLPLLHLFKFKGSSFKQTSQSLLIDTYQVYLRNIFLVCFSLSVARQFFGENIICHTDTNKFPSRYLETYCLINGTMTVNESDSSVFYHDYYQWVSLLLLLLALSFYFPFRPWSKKYGSFMEQLAPKDFSDCNRVYQLIHKSKGDCLFLKTLLLEGYYVLHMILHMCFIDWFFNYAWSKNGWKWQTISVIFPDTGKCYLKYISNGDYTYGKFICLLPLSTVYRKIFFVLYGLIVFMFVLHLIFSVYRVYLIYKYRISKMNQWWCLVIARQLAHHWESKNWLTEKMKHLKEFENLSEPTYMSMKETISSI